MNYRDVYRKICKHAAEHLYSLEVYDEFDGEDEDRIDRAIGELQALLYRKARRAENSLSGAIEEGGDGESNDGSLAFEDGVPCDHPGCASHIKHPCEMCGRTGARGEKTLSSGRVWHQFPEVEDADTN